MGRLTLGIDLGQRIDPSAIILVEELLPEAAPVEWRVPARPEITGADLVPLGGWRKPSIFVTRVIERHHGEPYKQVIQRVGELARNVRIIKPRDALVLAVDATGLGRPVVEGIADELRQRGVRCGLSAVVLTAGERLKGQLGDSEVRLSKAVMVSNLVGLLEAGRLKFPQSHPEAAALERELLAYQIRVSQNGADSYEGRGEHDDLVVALGLATIGSWREPTRIRGVA